MIKRLSITIFLFITLFSVASAQQESMYSQYMFNTLAINPAYAGSRATTSATALLRTQWIGIKGAPKTSTFTIDAPFKSNKVGLGLQLFNDKIGITNTTGGFVSYAYRIKLSEDDNFLSFGFQAGVSQFKANYTDAVLTNKNQPSDDAFSDNVSTFYGNFGSGIYYNTSNFYLGLSSPQLLSKDLSNFNSASKTDFLNQHIHVFLSSGYVFPIGESFNVKPSVLIKGVKGAPLEADLNTTVWIKDIVALGAQYRTNADIAGMIELKLSSQLHLGYSYDYSTTALNKFNSGSHEFMLRFDLKSYDSALPTPRYF